MPMSLHRRYLLAAAALSLFALAPALAADDDLARHVDPLIGSRNMGNTFPGAVRPFGMLAWSPENTRGDSQRSAAPGGYHYDATRIRGFSLTHLSGTGCRGASGDFPFMPHTGAIDASPALDADDAAYASDFHHGDELATAGSYRVHLDNGVDVALAASARAGLGRFEFPADTPAQLLLRASDSALGSTAAELVIDPEARTLSGSVTSGNFCGYLEPELRRSYYTAYFVAEFDRPFAATGTWRDGRVTPGATRVEGARPYDDDGYPASGRGAGGWVAFAPGSTVNVRVGLSYVSVDNARANLAAEIPGGATFETVAAQARAEWNRELSRIRVEGGDDARRTVFYTALYHSLLHPNLYSDVNGEYTGFDGRVHRVSGNQSAQYANFSGWDVYRSQLPLVALLRPDVAGDIGQSLLNQARQNGGKWDRWTHNAGETHVMNGDPSAPSIAGMVAFGADGFEVREAFESLVRAATVPHPDDRSRDGCGVACKGQRPDLDSWLRLGYVPADGIAWGPVADSLEYAIADFSLAALAQRLGDDARHAEFLARAQNWKRLYNPDATPHGGYLQNRNADGSWPDFRPETSDGFVEGSAAQYLWMVPFNPQGLFDLMGGTREALARLDGFFHDRYGRLAVTDAGPRHAELDNEPSIGAPWLYHFGGRPDAGQRILRQVLDTLWTPRPDGIPGNDDLGQMSSWYVWTAMGLYPAIPGRAELLLAAPVFERVSIARGGDDDIVIEAPGAPARPYVTGLRVDGRASTRSWLPEDFVRSGGRLRFDLGAEPAGDWGRGEDDRPPSFEPRTAGGVPAAAKMRRGRAPAPSTGL